MHFLGLPRRDHLVVTRIENLNEISPHIVSHATTSRKIMSTLEIFTRVEVSTQTGESTTGGIGNWPAGNIVIRVGIDG